MGRLVDSQTERLGRKLTAECQKQLGDGETVRFAWTAETGPSKGIFASPVLTVLLGWLRKHYLVAVTDQQVHVFSAQRSNMFRAQESIFTGDRRGLAGLLSHGLDAIQVEGESLRIERRWAPLITTALAA